MIEKITIEYCIRVGGYRHIFERNVRKDMWDSLSEEGRVQFIREQVWEDLGCGYRVIDKETS